MALDSDLWVLAASWGLCPHGTLVFVCYVVRLVSLFSEVGTTGGGGLACWLLTNCCLLWFIRDTSSSSDVDSARFDCPCGPGFPCLAFGGYPGAVLLLGVHCYCFPPGCCYLPPHWHQSVCWRSLCCYCRVCCSPGWCSAPGCSLLIASCGGWSS
jgi:hypothetical protein